ncbi:toprim domain-containing protein [Candidatus Phytoplasma sp. AldY-WA1]|uniref:toprim domain-containing protein n=1 Tax=Candidatus Phytoplasma sp. AldY-WA1 TaxID=2852100 RepID=UPI00254CB7D6|nr:toprim domain-containing protein [Candidatus Phytoplasma sp. AldY-WA1]
MFSLNTIKFISKIKKIDMLVLLKYLKIVPFDSDKSVRFNCFFHKSKSGISCNINEENKCWCWSCEKAFDTIDIYIKARHLNFKLDFKKACLELNKFYNSDVYINLKKTQDDINLQNDTNKKTVKKISYSLQFQKLNNNELIEQKKRFIKDYSFIFNLITNFYHNELLKNRTMLNYLFQIRRLNLETIKQFKIGFSDNNNNKLLKYFSKYKDALLKLDLIRYNKTNNFYFDTMCDCLVIPVLHNGNTIHFYKNNFKTITIYNPKYKALKSLTRDIFYLPYGFSFALNEIKKKQEVIIHEGFYDTINAHQHGIKNAISLITIKSYLSQPVINFFKKYDIKVLIGLDNDESGRKNAVRIQEQLNNENIDNEIKNIYEDNCKDADDILKKHGLGLYKKTYLNTGFREFDY